VADTKEGVEQQGEHMILASFAQEPGDEQDTTTQDDTGEKRVIDIDLYHLEGGAVLLIPKNGANPLDTNAIESVIHTPREQAPPGTEGSPLPLFEDEQEEVPQEAQPEPVGTGTKRRVKRSVLLVPVVLLCVLVAGIASSFFLLPLTASATITITPKARSLHSDATFPIAAHPKARQVQGRPLQASSFTQSATVPATGHAHDDATSAAGVITFYNADSSPSIVPAGVSFTAQGVTIVTDASVTVQAAIPPAFGIGITSAHVVQGGSIGNIAARAISTRCCGSDFVTATNTTPFHGGQDARSYSFIQTSDIHNAATTLLANLTPQATATLTKEARPGEQIVTPLCNPRTTSSQDAGAASASVTVTVTQHCYSVAYLTNSLNQVATQTLAQSSPLPNYEQVGTTQVTVNSATYEKQTAAVHVSLSGIWVYRFTQAQLTQLIRHLAGKSQKQAQATLEQVNGIASVSIHVQRFDFKDVLPTNPQRITVQFFYLVS